MVQTEFYGKKNRIKKDKKENSKLWIGDDETMELGVASELGGAMFLVLHVDVALYHPAWPLARHRH